MNNFRILAVVLVVLGVLALVYGGFSYTRETHEASIGALTLAVDDKQWVSLPVWSGVAAILAGGLLYYFASTRIRK